MMRSVFPIVLLGLCACAPQPESFPTLALDGDACGASGYATLLGQPKEAVAAMTFPAPMRLIGPGMAVTKDFRPQRLNLLYDESGVITRAYCG